MWKYVIDVVLALVTAGALTFCRYAYKQIQKYKNLMDQEQQKGIEILIEQKINPLALKIDSLQKYVEDVFEEYRKQIALFKDSYRFQIIHLCRQYLNRDYITQEQYDTLSEVYRFYYNLGGKNSDNQVQEYYDKVIALPIKQRQGND